MAITAEPCGNLTLIRVLGITLGVSLVVSFGLPFVLPIQKTANEANAIVSLRALVVAQEAYRYRQNPQSYARTPASLSDESLAMGPMRGYKFQAGFADANSYSYTCLPLKDGSSGDRSFFVDQTGIIRASDNGPATSSSPPLR